MVRATTVTHKCSEMAQCRVKPSTLAVWPEREFIAVSNRPCHWLTRTCSCMQLSLVLAGVVCCFDIGNNFVWIVIIFTTATTFAFHLDISWELKMVCEPVAGFGFEVVLKVSYGILPVSHPPQPPLQTHPQQRLGNRLSMRRNTYIAAVEPGSCGNEEAPPQRRRSRKWRRHEGKLRAILSTYVYVALIIIMLIITMVVLDNWGDNVRHSTTLYLSLSLSKHRHLFIIVVFVDAKI